MPKTKAPLELLTVVDDNNVAIGAYPRDVVHQELLNHRSVHILLFCEGSILIQKRADDKIPFPGYWDVSAAGHVRDGESYLDAALRELREELSLSCGDLHIISTSPAAVENGFEFCASCVGSISRSRLTAMSLSTDVEQIAWFGPDSMCRMLCLDVTYTQRYTFNLYQAMALLTYLDEHESLRQYRHPLTERIRQYYTVTHNAKYLPTYRIEPATTADYTILKREIENNLQGSSDWLRDLILVYDNARPYYPAPTGLEVGPLVLTRRAIDRFLKKVAIQMARRAREIRLVAKLYSGSLVADLIELHCGNLGIDVVRHDIRTRWVGHGRVDIVSGFSNPLRPMLNIVCDTMISSGATAKAIEQEIAKWGGHQQIVNVALVNVSRVRMFTPATVLSATRTSSHDWLLGFNSDALCEGRSRGRQLPFIVRLSPKDNGFRSLVVRDFGVLLKDNVVR